MPLIVPGITPSSSGDKTSDWQNKLMGKKLGDKHDEIVCTHSLVLRPLIGGHKRSVEE